MCDFAAHPPLEPLPADEFVLDTPALRAFVGEVCGRIADAPDARGAAEAIGPLFAATPNHRTASEFQDFFPSQVSARAAADLNDIDMDVPDVFNSGKVRRRQQREPLNQGE